MATVQVAAPEVKKLQERLGAEPQVALPNPFTGENFEPTKRYEPITDVKNDDLTKADMLAILSAAVDDVGLVGHNTNMYNHLLDSGLKQIVTTLFKIDRPVRNERTQTDADRKHKNTRLQIEFSDLEVGRPTHSTYPTGEIVDLIPNNARKSGTAYAAPVTITASATLTAYFEDGHEEVKHAEIPPFQATSFPIMRSSNRCHTYNCTREMLKKMEEDPNEPGGYFIAKSQEWVVDLLENIRFNTLHIHIKMQTNERVRGEFISQAGGPFENSSQIIVRFMTNGEITIEVNSTKLSKVRIPFYLIYRMLGMTSDRDIVSTIVHDLETAMGSEASPVAVKELEILEKALHMSNPVFASLQDELDRETVIQSMAEKLSRFLTNPSAYLTNDHAIQYLNTDLINILDKVLLPHTGITPEFRHKKLRFIGLMIHKILLADMGIISPTDRDAVRNKRVHGPPQSLAKAFKTQFNNSIVASLIRAFKRELKNNPFSSITVPNMIDTFRNSLSTADFIRAMTHALTSGNKPIVIKRRAVTNRVSSQNMERKNELNMVSALRTITTHNASNASKQTERADMMRRVHPTYTGYICVAQSADTGENVGMRKQLALTASVRDAGESLMMKMRLLADTAWVIPIDKITDAEIERAKLARIYCAGELIGACKHGRLGSALAERYRALRREGRVVDQKTTIAWDPVVDEVEFLLDVGCLIRPLIIVDNNLYQYDEERMAAYKEGRAKTALVAFTQNMRITKRDIIDIIAGRKTLQDLVREGKIEFITPEEQENCLIAPSIDALRKNRHNVCMRYTHCDIEQAIFGLAALVSPYGNHTQPARVTYETNQGRQTGGWFALSFPFRTDKNRFFQIYNEIPLVRTLAHKYVLPNGMNVTMAYMSYGGDNMEDSAIVSQAAADRDLFAGAFFRFEKAELEKGEMFCNPDPLTTKNLKPNASYEKLVDGFIPVGTIVRRGDVLMGRVVKLTRGRGANDADAKYLFSCRSIVYRLEEPGIVDAVMKPRGANDEVFGLVKLRFERPLRVGDKMSSRSGNKQITAVLASQSDLPFTQDGTTPEIIVNTHCLAGDTPITTYYGVSKRIDSLPDDGGAVVWGWDEKQNGFIASPQKNLQHKGIGQLHKLTLEDGRTLRCTAEHPILTIGPENKPTWVRAKDLSPAGAWDGKKWTEKKTPGHKIVMGLEAPLDNPTENEKLHENEWVLSAATYDFNMTSDEEREKSLAFARILGLVCSDGTLGKTRENTDRANVYVGHLLDADILLRDIEILTGKRPACSRPDDVYTIALPAVLARAVGSVPGMISGRKVEQPGGWPPFLFEDECPISMVREFLGGLFGGDGHAPFLMKIPAKNRKAKDGKDRLLFGGVAFSQSVIQPLQNEMRKKMVDLCALLEICGVTGARVDGPIYRTDQPETKSGVPRVQYGIRLPTSSEFGEKVGFRYCIQKNCRLSAANAYWRYIEKIEIQHNWVFARTSELYETKASPTIQAALTRAGLELMGSAPPLNEYYSLLTKDIVHNRRRSTGRLTTLNKLDYTRIMDPEEFLTKAGCFSWFYFEGVSGKKRIYITTLKEKSLPIFTLELKDMRTDAQEQVYDIEVPKTHSFLSSGVVTHNSLPSRMTLGQMLETSVAKVLARKGIIADGTAFLPVSTEEIADELLKNGFRFNGRERMYNGMTGEYLDTAIFIGSTYQQRLQKFVYDDEYSVAGSGPTDATTGQPLGGKNVHGGLRIGEMEGWALAAQGAAMNWFEKFSVDSDGRKDYRCRCGNRGQYNERFNIYRCKTCNEMADIAEVDSSKAAIVYQEEIASANVHFRLGLRPRSFEERPVATDKGNQPIDDAELRAGMKDAELGPPAEEAPPEYSLDDALGYNDGAEPTAERLDGEE